MVKNYDKYKDRLEGFWKSGYNFGVDRKSGEPMECSCDYTIASRCSRCKFFIGGECPTQRSEWLESPSEPELVEYSGNLNKESNELLKSYLIELNKIAIAMCHQSPDNCTKCPYHNDGGCGYLALIDLLIESGTVITVDANEINSYIEKMHKKLKMED